MQRDTRPGLTLVELLVVIAIIGVLVGMLLPAVQSVREASRRLACANNLKQLALGAQSHLTANGAFPTNGWSWAWFGDPDRGADWRQPGGWVFNLLPYVDQMALYQIQAGKTGDDKWTAAAQLMQTLVPTMQCPSRRAGKLTKAGGSADARRAFPGKSPPAMVAKTDYAGNGGETINDGAWIQGCAAPSSWSPSYMGPPDYPSGVNFEAAAFWTCGNRSMKGVMFAGSVISPAHIRDGLSSTYLCGEKYLNPDNYENAGSPGDNESMYIGDNADISRFVAQAPMQDTRGLETWYPFGASHAVSFNMAFCDGSVRSIAYTISPTTHQRLGNRRDGQTIDIDTF